MVDHTTFYDHRGNPIKRNTLTADPQTSRIASLYTEFEHHPSRGLTPGKLATILQGAEQGQLLEQCHLFADIEEKDGHVFAEMGKRKRALLGLDWDIVAPRNASPAEQKAAELAKEIIQDMTNLSDIILDMADAIGYAYSNLEMTWERVGKEWLPEKIDHRPPSWFTVLQKDRDELRLRNNTLDGAPLQPFTWISHVHKSTSGFLPRAGLHRVLAWPFLFKNYSVRDLAEFLEVYGLPMRLGTYPSGSSDDEKNTLLRAVTTIGHSAAGIVPEGMMIDFKDAAEGASDPYMAMINWCEKTQSKAILGGTLTSQADGASSTNALGNVHNEVRHDLMNADAMQIARTLTRDLIYPVIALNTAAISSLRRCPRFVFFTQEADDLTKYAEAIPKLVNVGMRIPESHLYQRLQIPEPNEDERILQVLPSMPALNDPMTAPLRAQLNNQRCPHCSDSTTALKGERQPEPNDLFADRLEQSANPHMTDVINTIKSLVDESESFEQLQQKLLTVYASLDTEELSLVMAEAFATADLTGRFEINEGN